MKLSRIVLSIALLSSLPLQAGVVNVGSGSYTTDHPGYDQAGRNKTVVFADVMLPTLICTGLKSTIAPFGI